MLLICNDYCVGVLKANWIFSSFFFFSFFFSFFLSLIFYPSFCFCCYKINRYLLPCPYFVKMYFLHEQSKTECVTNAELTDVKLQLISFILRSLFSANVAISFIFPSTFCAVYVPHQYCPSALTRINQTAKFYKMKRFWLT